MNRRQLKREIAKLKCQVLSLRPPRDDQEAKIEWALAGLRELAQDPTQEDRDWWDDMTPEQREQIRKQHHDTPESARVYAELIKILDKKW